LCCHDESIYLLKQSIGALEAKLDDG
jgi:hypothetical protein